ncbi:hypothetical protein Tco_0954967, partial [Tanacetum coccineum]
RYFDLFQEQARARRASEDNIGVVEERRASEDKMLIHGTDIAKITRKRSKPDKHGHGNGKSAQEPEVF